MRKINFSTMAACLAVAVSCTNSKHKDYLGTTTPRHAPNEMWVNNSTEPQHIDPQLSTGVPDGEIVRNIFARLVQIDPITARPVPDLAKRWEISSDGTEYTFYLRENLKWSDGAPLTAQDVEYGFKRLVDPQIAAEYASLAYDVKNSEPFNKRALLITGLADAVTEEELKKALETTAPIASVKASDVPKGFFVYPDDEKKPGVDLRQALIDAHDGKPLLGQSVAVKVADSSVVQAVALDPLTFKVKLTSPLPYFLFLMEFTIFAPAPKHVIEKVIQERGIANMEMWTRPETVVCSAAHCLTQEIFKQYKLFEKNPHYWDAAKVRIDRIKLFSIESYNTTLFMYQTGELDWIGNSSRVPSEFINSIKHFKDYKNGPYLSVYYYSLNTQVKPLTDQRVRKALALAIDREKITKLTGGDQLPYASMVPDGLAGYKGLNLPLFEPEKAKQLLADAGYPDGKGFPNLKILFNTTELHKTIAEAVQQMWKDNLNLDIELRNAEWKVYLDDMLARKYDIVRRGWVGDFPDPYTFLETMQSDSGNNRTGWSNKEYDRLLKQGNQETDLNKRLETLAQAERIAMEEAAFVPFYVYTSPTFIKPYFKGWWPDIQEHHSWNHWWIDERWYNGVPTESIEDKPIYTLEE